MSTRKKMIMAIVITIAVVVIGFYLYRHFLEFNNKKVEGYIKDEAMRYSDSDNAASIIRQGARDILGDRQKLMQLRKYAKASGLEKERALVQAATIAARNYGYIA